MLKGDVINAKRTLTKIKINSNIIKSGVFKAIQAVTKFNT